MKDTELCRVSSTLHQFHLHQNQDIFCIAFHKQGSYVVHIIFRPCDLLTFCSSFLIKVGHPENLLSLYLSSPQCPSGNRATFLWSKGVVGYNKKRTYYLKGFMLLMPRLLLVFLAYQLFLLMYSQAHIGQRTRKLGSKHWLNNAVLF